MQSTGLVSFAAVMWILGRWPAFEPGMVPYAIALGLTGVIAVAALYRGLALGPVAVVAPVVASYVVITVILVVIFLGERLTLAQILAASLVFVGVVLTSTDARELRVTLGRPVPGVRIVLALGTTVGILDTLANGLFARGIESGYASLAATGTGMYPIVPAVLGMLALGERIAPNQIVGIVILVIGLATLGAVS